VFVNCLDFYTAVASKRLLLAFGVYYFVLSPCLCLRATAGFFSFLGVLFGKAEGNGFY